MSAAVAALEPWIPRPESHREWPELSVRAPQLVVSVRRYLLQLTTFLSPRSVEAADQTLRQCARWLVTQETPVRRREARADCPNRAHSARRTTNTERRSA